MSSRRKIREATIQLLYSREADPVDRDEEKLWILIQEQSLTTWNRARLKLLLHLQQGRRALTAKFQKTTGDAVAAIDTAEPGGKLTRAISKLLQEEEKWCDKMENIPRLAKADIGAWQNDLTALLTRSQKLAASRTKIIPRLAGFPPAQEEALTRIIERLNAFDLRARQIANPLSHPEQPELAHLRKTQSEMAEFRRSVTDFADQITSQNKTSDPLLEKHARNFSLKRFSKVDLAILRLATWELTQKNDLTPAIIINEAVEIAKRFGTSDSASFINGLLDQIARQQSAQKP